MKLLATLILNKSIRNTVFVFDVVMKLTPPVSGAFL